MSAFADRRLICVGRARVDSLSSAKSLTAPTGYTLSQIAVVVAQPRTQAIYYTLDGSTPTSTVGFDGVVGRFITIDDPANFKALEAVSGATIEVAFFIQAGTV